jgi:hypothetical protein
MYRLMQALAPTTRCCEGTGVAFDGHVHDELIVPWGNTSQTERAAACEVSDARDRAAAAVSDGWRDGVAQLQDDDNGIVVLKFATRTGPHQHRARASERTATTWRPIVTPS